MTPSEPMPKLRLTANNEYTNTVDYDTRLTVFNGHGERAGEAFGEKTLRLPRGIYTIRAERFGEIGEDIVILHEKDGERTIPIPRRHSAMPSTDTSHTHEFLQAAGHHYSRNSTWDDPGADDADPRLMILVRSTGDVDHSEVFPAKSLSLFAEDGELATRFEPEQTKRHQHEGWVAFSTRMKPGNYILADIRETRAVALPILLHERWDTLIFVPFEDRPRLSAASVDICDRNHGYNPDDRFTQQIDAALQGFGMRLNLLPDDLRNEAIYGKFSHPFHGLIGAHAHFLGTRKSEKLERQVLKNLWKLLKGSVDVIALLLLAQEREEGVSPKSIAELNALAEHSFGESLEAYLPLSFPPILRTGLNSLIRTSLDIPELIAPGSWLETAANSSYADGAWSVWDQEAFAFEAESHDEAFPSPPVLSPNKLYGIVKRAIAEGSSRAVHSIYANDRMSDFIDVSTGMLGILRSISRDMPEFEIDADPAIVASHERVRDLTRRVGSAAQPRSAIPSSLSPDTNIPDWLVDMVDSRMKSDGGDYSPLAVARMVGVPLKSVERAAELVVTG